MDDRLIQLEERLAYQARLLDQLDTVVLDFTRRLLDLEDRVRELEQAGSAPADLGPHDVAPPHY